MSTRYPVFDFKLLLYKRRLCLTNFDSFDKFKDYELPLREEFISTLRFEECSQNDYNYAQSGWATFGCATLEYYLKFYLESDVCLFADFFQNFRSI